MLTKDSSEEEIVKFFEPLGCIPEDYGPEFDREGCALYFEEHLNAFLPRQDDEGNWRLEYVMFCDSINDITPEFAIDDDNLNKITRHVLEKLSDLLSPVPFAYVWWSGTDQPYVKPSKIQLP